MQEIISILVGLGSGALLTAFGVLLQSGVTERRDRKRRRAIAYIRLMDILHRIDVRTAGQRDKAKRISEEELDKIGEIVADNSDALDEDTIEAWKHRNIVQSEPGPPDGKFYYYVELDQFFDSVRVRYQRLSSQNPYHHLA